MGVMEYLVGPIVAQKDEYRDASGNALSFQQFWEDERQSAEVSEFKRFKVSMTLRFGGDKEHEFALLILPRSNTIRVISTDGPNKPDVIFGTLDTVLRTYWSGPRPRHPAVVALKPGAAEVSVHDAIWYAAILHELRVYGPITVTNGWVGIHSPETRD